MLEVQGVSKSFEGLAVLQSVSLDVAQGRIVGLIGPNGSGKSTLFDIISGFQHADAGRVAFRGTRIDGRPPHTIARAGLMRTFQLSEDGQRLTALENLLAAAQNQIEANLPGAVLGLARMIRIERVNLARAKDVLALLGLIHVANEYVGRPPAGPEPVGWWPRSSGTRASSIPASASS
jgi:branched-chain amino acid transport system ATP-binding protein